MDLTQRTSGILLHITSLPGPHGIGDFGPDAQRFVDWLASAGQTVWQWLPTTPIGPGNSPYQSVSAFAGSPLMVAFEPLVAAGWMEPQALHGAPVRDRGARVDFDAVVPWRLERLRLAHAGFERQATAAERAALAAWRADQAWWLDDYLLFMALEAAHGGQCWWDWEAGCRDRDPKAMQVAAKKHAAEMDFWAFVQWCFDTQLAQLRAYAAQRGVRIMGDLPIFIAHHSADCWARPDLYELDEHHQPTVVAGCPPDDFSEDGQRWGNPLYRWDRMAAEDYAWWTARVRRALAQADVFRIDHFRGFAGYWEIPASCPTAREGRWVPGPRKALFDAIEKALGRLPIVAEDLGLITPDVLELRDGCGFPGMRIFSQAFGGDGTHDFLPHNYVVNTLVYTGTHDNETVHGWWSKATPAERHFAASYLNAWDHDIHWGMIRAASQSVACMAVFPLQDVLGLGAEHRMNLPGSMGPHNWTWRMDWSMVNEEARRVLGLITAASGRGPFSLLG
ncbi:MAG: 4-alpha-glucanotransferase [Betaproteobacteria bacterium]|nr:4-alpha-glucanotransferase [Betaproteobacteria bacterium]